MKIGMNLLLWTAAADDSHLPLLDKIRKWGFDGIELPMFAPDCSPWKKYAKALDGLGMGCTVVAVLPQELSLIDKSKQARGGALAHLKKCVDSCAEVGAEVLVGPIYHPVGKLAGRGPTDDERNRCVEGLTALGDYAAKTGLLISVEPLNRFETYFLNCVADGIGLVDKAAKKNVGLLYDTFHANIEEKNLSKAIASAGKRINHVHVSANDRATPGEDHVDYATTFKALKKARFDGWLTIESFGSWLPELAGATCIWREMAPSAEHVAKKGCAFVRKAWAAA